MTAHRRELSADEVQGVVDQISDVAGKLEESGRLYQRHQTEMSDLTKRLRSIAQQLTEGST